MIPVQLPGLPVDMGPVLELARQHNLVVVEDACRAHGATYQLDGRDRRAGSLGVAAAFSFYPGKNLGAMGEAGAVVTGDDRLASHMRIWRDYGQSQRYKHISPDGWNGRLDALQCAILDIKLPKLDEWNERRRRAAGWYRESGWRTMSGLCCRLSRRVASTCIISSWCSCRTGRRPTRRCLIGASAWACTTPFRCIYRPRIATWGESRRDFPQAEVTAASVLSLPMFTHISEDQVDRVCEVLKEAV